MFATELVAALFGVALAVGVAWFWPHCARPTLLYRSAGPITTRFLFGMSLYTIVAEAVFLVLAVRAPSRDIGARSLRWALAPVPTRRGVISRSGALGWRAMLRLRRLSLPRFRGHLPSRQKPQEGVHVGQAAALLGGVQG